ncbi:MAG: acyl-CoA dehydrogenase family protein [Acidobacteria bacterium]|nr:acyl-CoA dehydrogenase family protein [Acidobacteriota bacterium]
MTGTTDIESVETFRARSKAWIEANLPLLSEPWVETRELQRLLFDNGYAGISYPKEYGGAGLTIEHQKAFYDIVAEQDRQVPSELMVSIGIIGPTILDNGSQELKQRFLPPLLRGDEVWMQLLSEPRGGSDMAGTTCRLKRDGDTYFLNGSKMWSSGAYHADYGLCLCRSDWDAPKHRGLSTIAVPLQGNPPGLTIERTRAVSGEAGHFCEEFFDDMPLPADNLIGEENAGWSVAQSLLFHERNAVGGIGMGYLGGWRRGGGAGAFTGIDVGPLREAAERRGVGGAVGTMIADAVISSVVDPLTSDRITLGLQLGTHKGHRGSLSKLQSSLSLHGVARAALAIEGAAALVWDGDDVQLDNAGTSWLAARGSTIAGGTSEMQRNTISERLLGLPREPAFDRDIPFNEVLRNLGKF